MFNQDSSFQAWAIQQSSLLPSTLVSPHPVQTHAKAVQRALVSWNERRSCPNLFSTSRTAPSSSRRWILPDSTHARRHGPVTEKRDSTTPEAPRTTSLSRAPFRKASLVLDVFCWILWSFARGRRMKRTEGWCDDRMQGFLDDEACATLLDAVLPRRPSCLSYCSFTVWGRNERKTYPVNTSLPYRYSSTCTMMIVYRSITDPSLFFHLSGVQ